jgi:DNA replication factor GINS|tara:strand:+ start:171 stop:551 length:381 start_codon:yes stop_codon:yes gene_type:complete
MSEENKINTKYLQLLVLQESENNAIQKLDSNIYNSISEFISDLKSEEYDGIDAKIKNTLLDMITELTSFLLKLRLEKASLNDSNSSALLDVEKYILDSQKEMEERKEMILSRILNGKSELLGSNDQ